MDFPSLCAYSGLSLTNLIGSCLILIVFAKPIRAGMSLDLSEVVILGANLKRSAASGEENEM